MRINITRGIGFSAERLERAAKAVGEGFVERPRDRAGASLEMHLAVPSYSNVGRDRSHIGVVGPMFDPVDELSADALYGASACMWFPTGVFMQLTSIAFLDVSGGFLEGHELGIADMEMGL